MIKFYTFIFLIVFNLNTLYSHTIYPVNDFVNISKNTVQISKKDVPLLIGTIGITTILFINDGYITERFQSYKNPTFSKTLDYSQYFGVGWYTGGFGLLNIMLGEALGNKQITAFGIYTIEGLVISGIFVTVIKGMVGRARPYVDQNPYDFHPFTLQPKYFSFYSGHTTTAFSFASIMAHYFNNVYLSSLAYTLASLTGLQRIYFNKHWSSDVFIGALAGVLIGRQVVKLNKNYKDLEADGENIRLGLYTKNF